MSPTLLAAEPIVGPYVSLGGGFDLLQNEIVKPVNPEFGPNKREYRFDTGTAVAAAVGYGLGNGLRLEVEGDYAYAHVQNVRYSVPLRAGGYEQQYGGFFNAIYDVNFGTAITPYFGAGAGYQRIELDGVYSAGLRRIGNGGRAETTGDFGYQGIAGLSVATPIPNLSLTAEYRLIGVVTPPSLVRGSSNGNVVNGVPAIPRATFGNIFNHELLVGVRYAFGQPAPAPAAEEPAPLPAPTPMRTYLVFFDWDRADLTDRARQIVVQAAQASTHVQTTRIEVNGYTDLSGGAAYNQGLSVRRAQAVQGELVRNGVPAAAITIHGLGEANPLVPTAQGVREPQNRRVEIILK